MARSEGRKKNRCPAYARQVRVRIQNNLLPLEVREEILGTKVNDKRSDGPWLVEGIVNEKTTCSKTERQREQQ